jgi:hypothetical protein
MAAYCDGAMTVGDAVAHDRPQQADVFFLMIQEGAIWNGPAV